MRVTAVLPLLETPEQRDCEQAGDAGDAGGDCGDHDETLQDDHRAPPMATRKRPEPIRPIAG